MSETNEQTTDWVAIEGAYRAGVLSVRAIARANQISESAIRKRAEKAGWLRDPSGTKRERVKAHFAGGSATKPKTTTHDAGTQPGTQKKTVSDRPQRQTVRVVERNAREIVAHHLDEATEEDIEDMQAALSNARQCLRSLSAFIGGAAEAKELKTLLEANGLAIDQIRRIRGLDEPKKFDELEALKVLVDARWLPKDLLVTVGEHYGKLKPSIKSAFQSRMGSDETE